MKAHHISLLTADVEQNIHFYTEVLGLRLIKNSINQANSKMRHVYYGDFMGTPGTVVTFFPIPVFRKKERVDGKNFFDGIRFSIPKGTANFWVERLTQFGFNASLNARGEVKSFDPDKIPLTFTEIDKVNFDWHINYMSDVEWSNQITGILGTDLYVPNVDETANFFRDVFHLDVKGNVVNLEENHAIYLHQTDTDAVESKFGKGSIDHFALDALNQEELELYWGRAKEYGYTRELMVDRGYFRSIYFREPGGNRVEVATTNPGFTLDESLFDLGSKLSLPPRFNGDRQEIVDYYDDKGIHFDDANPYTGTGHLSGSVEVVQGDVQKNTND